jgi:type II secretory pathway pseudopilin PulG
MPLKSLIQLTALALLAIFTIAISVAWRAEQRARAQLQQQLKSAQDQIAAATTRQSSRNAALNQQLTQLQKLQADTKSPSEILQALPTILPLPTPLTLDPCSGRTLARPDARRDRSYTAAFAPPQPANTGYTPGQNTKPAIPLAHSDSEGSVAKAYPDHRAALSSPPPTSAAEPPIAVPTRPAPQIILPIEDLKPLYDSAVRCKECQLQLTATQADLKDEQTKSAALSRELTNALHVANGGSPLRRVARAAKWFLVGAAVGAAATKFTR